MVFTIGLGDTILQEHIPGASFFIMMIVIIKSSPETIKQICFLLNYEVNNRQFYKNSSYKLITALTTLTSCVYSTQYAH